MGTERQRVAGFGQGGDGLRHASDWYLWGPYVSERQRVAAREDDSAGGRAWQYPPHEHARSRAHRGGEDGLAGFCDIDQRLCLSLALWNGRDPILKERAFGLASTGAGQGEDVNEYLWYLDAVPSHAWNRWRYHYPQAEFPYAQLCRENGRRGKLGPGYQLLDTGVFDDDRFWIVEVCYAKADPADILMAVTVTNAGPQERELHVLPTAWFRNTWHAGLGAPKPVMRAAGDGRVLIAHPFLGELTLTAGPGPDGPAPTWLFCENETNTARVFGVPGPPFPKDGINDHVVSGAATVNPAMRGTKCACWYRLGVAPGATAQVRLRLRAGGGGGPSPLGADFDRVIALRRAEADEFYAKLTPSGASADEAMVMRQAFAGMLWSKQLYDRDVTGWRDGGPAQPAPLAVRRNGRNARLRDGGGTDIISVPDKRAYPWTGAWDLAFHCVALAHLDPAFAKYQLTLLCRDWFQQPGGTLPAYEWDFDDVDPPVQAWAALEVFAIDGGRDVAFLGTVFDNLLASFTSWLSQDGPGGAVPEQPDATGWMAFHAVAMAGIAAVLHRSGRTPAIDLVLKFLDHFTAISAAIDGQGIWDSTDGLYYEKILTTAGTVVPVKVRSMVGIIAALAVAVIDERTIERSAMVGRHFDDFLDRRGLGATRRPAELGLLRGEPGDQRLLLSVAGVERLEKLFAKLFDEGEFLSPYGLRALSAYDRDHWRGPLWFPLNYLVISVLERYHRFFGDELTFEYPTGSGRRLTPGAIARDLQDRLISIFIVGPDGRRPCFGWVDRLQRDPAWKHNLVFDEFFHGANAAGLVGSHQAGWTGIIADVIRRRHGGLRGNGEAGAGLGVRSRS